MNPAVGTMAKTETGRTETMATENWLLLVGLLIWLAGFLACFLSKVAHGLQANSIRRRPRLSRMGRHSLSLTISSNTAPCPISPKNQVADSNRKRSSPQLYWCRFLMDK